MKDFVMFHDGSNSRNKSPVSTITIYLCRPDECIRKIYLQYTKLSHVSEYFFHCLIVYGLLKCGLSLTDYNFKL